MRFTERKSDLSALVRRVDVQEGAGPENRSSRLI